MEVIYSFSLFLIGYWRNSGKLGDNFRDSFGGGKNGLFGGGNSNAHGVIQGAEGPRRSSAQGHGVSNDYQQNARQQRAQDKFDRLAQNKLDHQGAVM